MKKLEVQLFSRIVSVYFQNQDCIVVVIDIFRATSAMCTAFEHGVNSIIPVASVEEAQAYKSKGYLVGAERGGEIVEGFDFGNSPFSYMSDDLKGQSLVLTTTNGTVALNIAKKADQVVVGSFLNLTALCRWLEEQQKDILLGWLLLCGWKRAIQPGRYVVLGAVIDRLIANPSFSDLADSAIAAHHLYSLAKADMGTFLERSSHRKRLKRLHLEKDINYCLQMDLTDQVPILRSGELVPLTSNVNVSQTAQRG